jgi:hypothetical protein
VNKLHASMALLLSLGAAAAPAVAGTVFVPLASNISNGGAGYATKVWVSNPDSATHHFTTTFIQEGTDGTASSSTSGSIFVASSATSVLTGVAPPGVTGLLEVDGPAPLVVSARMEVTDANGNLIGIAAVPALTQDNAVAAGGFVEVQGLQEGPGLYTTDFSLVNLGTNVAQCTVGVFNSAGGLIAPVGTLTVMPLSRRDFGGVLQTLGVPAITDVRVVATCNQTFYAFATVFQPGAAAISVIGPAPSLAGSVGPGAPSTGGNPAGTVTFSVPGNFLNATQANSEQLYDLPAPVGVPYKLATIAWDMRIGTFPTGLFTGVMSFRRPNSQRGLREPFCAVQIVNRNSKTLLDLGVENVFERTVGPWKQDSTYHCQLTYDLTGNTCQLDVSLTAGGAIIYTIAGPAQWFDMSANSNPLVVDFGQTGIGDGAYYPPVSWSFSNLNVVLVPK